MNDGTGRFTLPCAGGAHDKTIFNRIMPRFRPIAPKPATDTSFPGNSPAVNQNKPITKRRAKRKYVRVSRNRKYKKNKAKEKIDGFDDAVTTLPLPPQMAGLKTTSAAGGPPQNRDFPVVKSVPQLPLSINLNKSESGNMVAVGGSDLSDRTAVMKSRRVVESWVIVEGLTEGCMDGGELGSTDMEKMKNLKMDTCPGLISDGFDKVQWVNLPYMRMVDPQIDEEPPPEMVAWLVVKDKLPVQKPVFACRVRVVNTWRKEKQSQIMPCDVWRMDFGGFAWRLDVRTALSLGP
ncbi:unnamed protein product [Ilex paraguariensis]|uniref:DUF7950 domain-containing protein n=1 Tax=Ilex paraguariensis TaxID=185542 RepID=A0ABC8V0V8_9AQUA